MLAAIYTAKAKMAPTLISFPDGVDVVCSPRERPEGVRGQHVALSIEDELANIPDEVLVAEARRRRFFVIGNAK
jgi:hypothetical protein